MGLSKSDTRLSNRDGRSAAGTRRVGILLLPDFPLMSYASVVEPLRAANALAGKRLYAWTHVSTNGRPVKASSGVEIRADGSVGDALRLDMLLICAGGNPSTFRHAPTLRWLRKVAHGGVPVGGVSGGPFVLARAGLLDGYRCTIHWEHFPAFVEEFPAVGAERSLFVIDRGRLTCAGGISALDMMHALIEQEHGHDLAAAVSEWFLQTQIRSGSGPQRMSARERFDVSHPALLRVLEYMAARIETPATREQLARVAGLSVRQLERLFARHLGASIGVHYLAIRLDRARILLRQTGQPVLAVAVATGFMTASHFSRMYRQRYALPPNADRTSGRARSAARPRLRRSPVR